VIADIVGRDEELSTLTAFVENFPVGPIAVMLGGEAGAGKTTLWQAGVEAADERSFTVLETRPAEAERGLSFVGVADLLAGTLDDILPHLPEPQVRALRVALLLDESEGRPPDRRTIAAGFLGSLRALAARSPLIVAVDDVQWLDAPSAAVLAFAARRLQGEPVGFLVAERRGEGEPDPLGLARSLGDRLERVDVGPLGLEALHNLFHARVDTSFSRPTLHRLHEVSGGNPFFALELARALEQRGGQLAPGEPLPVPAELDELVQHRVAALPADTRAALAAAAALSQPTVSLTSEALGLPPSAFDPAVEAHVMEVANGRIRFAHPLLASGAYAAVGPARRAELHARLAAVVSDIEERARHLAAAASEPDPEVAAALDDAARSARVRGAPATAAELSELAAQRTPNGPSPEERRRRTYAAVCHFESGDAGRARVLLEDVLAEVEPGTERAHVLANLARVRSYGDDIRAAADLFAEAIEEAGEDELVSADAHEGLAVNLFRLRERLADAVDHAKAAVELATAAGNDTVAAEALGSQLLAEAALGREDAPGTLRSALALQANIETGRVVAEPKFQAGVCWLWWDEFARARSAFDELLGRTVEIGDESSVPYILVLLGWTECLQGDFAQADRHVSEGLAHAEQVGQATLVAYLLGLRVLVLAHTGPPDEAAAEGDRALELAARARSRPAEYLARWGLGLAALSRADTDEALRSLAPIVDLARRESFAEPGATRFITDAAEALAQTAGDEAAELLDWYEGHAGRLGRRSALASCARCRGLLAAETGDLDGARAALTSALAEHQHAPLPFDRARTLLVLGTVERRAKRKRAAREALEEALAVFKELGARPWAKRAHSELARIGGRAPSAGALTPTERRVAELVGQGRSNKEVAAALFVTVKTVEAHLSRIYAKLGVRSRAELAHRLSQDLVRSR
jgi:DNA-binding CsgD family transcriptional regulator